MILEKDDIALVNTNYSCIERRCSPRIDTVFKVKFADNTIGNILNINEAGACIVSPKSIDSKTVPVEIILFPKPITLKVHLIWSKKDSENNGFIHGLKFINLPKGALPLIMRSLIYRQLRSVIKNIKDKKARSEIVKFAKCFKQYLFDLFDLSHDLEKNKVSQENALHKLTDLTNKIMEKGDLLELRLANRVLIKKIKQNFRTLVSSWAYKSFIVKRSLDKPRGYPGDYKIIETIYRKENI